MIIEEKENYFIFFLQEMALVQLPWFIINVSGVCPFLPIVVSSFQKCKFSFHIFFFFRDMILDSLFNRSKSTD